MERDERRGESRGLKGSCSGLTVLSQAVDSEHGRVEWAQLGRAAALCVRHRGLSLVM
jgi:hypothetical protein